MSLLAHRGLLLNSAFTPASLFAGGEEGFWFDPSDLSTLFQDSAGTTPVTAAGDPVGRINDKSGRGRNALQTTAGSRPLLQQDGSGNYYLSFDGTDDSMVVASYAAVGSGHSAAVAAYPTTVAAGNRRLLDSDSLVGAGRVSQMLRIATATPQSIAFNTSQTPFTDAAANVSVNTAVVLAQVTTTSAVEIWKNGVSNGSTAITGTLQTASTAVRMGARVDAAGDRFSGRIYGAVQIARALTSQERASLDTFLGGKCGLTL